MRRHHLRPAPRSLALSAALLTLMCAAGAGTGGDVYIGRNTTLSGEQTGETVRIGWPSAKDYDNDTHSTNPTVNIIKGAVINADISVQHGSTLNMRGGGVKGSIYGWHNSQTNIGGGAIKGNIEIKNQAALTIGGGRIVGSPSDGFPATIAAYHHSVISLRGGHFTRGVELFDGATLHIYGTGLKDARDKTHLGVHHISGRLADKRVSDYNTLRNQFDNRHISGVLADGTAFDKQIHASRASEIVLHNAPADRQPGRQRRICH